MGEKGFHELIFGRNPRIVTERGSRDLNSDLEKNMVIAILSRSGKKRVIALIVRKKKGGGREGGGKRSSICI